MRFSKGHVASIIDFLDEISYEAGLKIQIHSQDEPPFIHELGKFFLPSYGPYTRFQGVIFLGYGSVDAGPIDRTLSDVGLR